MAEEKETKLQAEPKKGKNGKKGNEGKDGKKNKLPVLIVLAAMLAGGGFFGLKMTKGGKPEAPTIKLGDEGHVVSLGEFMVNTTDNQAFLKATVFIHLADGTQLFGEGGGHGSGPGPEATAPYVDVVRSILASQSTEALATVDGEEKLKRQIAKSVNELYHERHKEGDKKHAIPAKAKGEPEWQSETGPVLVVYLTEYIWEFLSR